MLQNGEETRDIKIDFGHSHFIRMNIVHKKQSEVKIALLISNVIQTS